MKRNSTPGGGSTLDERIRQRRVAQARIQDEILRKSLLRWERLVLTSAERSSVALTATWKDTETTLSTMISGSVRELSRELNRLRGRLWHPWLAVLLGMALTLSVQAATVHWGWPLIRPQLERLALNRAGLAISVDPDGNRWMRLPQGSTTWTSTGSYSRLDLTTLVLIGED